MSPPHRLSIVIGGLDRATLGPYERTVQRVARYLRGQGHEVTAVTVRADIPTGVTLSRQPSRALARKAPGFVRHISQLTAFRRVDVSRADLVISTDPPSHGLRHGRHLALFHGYDRQFYDLADLMVAAGLAPDGPLHMELAALVRETDRPDLEAVTRFLTPSLTVQHWLHEFNRIDRVTELQPGFVTRAVPDDEPTEGDPSTDAPARLLCVSRHEVPARTELFVQTAHLLPDVTAVCVGEGDRLEWVRRVDQGLDRISAVAPERLWRRPPNGALPVPAGGGSAAVTFIPWTRRDQLESLYQEATCVVAPGFKESYGYSVLDAMSWGTPVVACRDGGSVAEIVEATGSGLVVDPEARALAEAVRRLVHDRELARKCRGNALAALEHEFSWPRAFEGLDHAIDLVMQA